MRRSPPGPGLCGERHRCSTTTSRLPDALEARREPAPGFYSECERWGNNLEYGDRAGEQWLHQYLRPAVVTFGSRYIGILCSMIRNNEDCESATTTRARLSGLTRW